MQKSDNPLRILLVEDHEQAAWVIKFSFEMLGHRVVSATDGKIAVDFLSKEEFDVIILDILMPSYDGVWFLKNYEGDVPVIVYSGWSDMTILPSERPPFVTLLKPMTAEEMMPYLEAAAQSRTG